MKKQEAWAAICKIPRSPAKQEKPLISLQHAISLALLGRTSTLESEDVPEVVPRRTKYGEIPKEDLRAMIRTCWGIYDNSIPKKITL